MQDHSSQNGLKRGLGEGDLVFMLGEELKKPLTSIKMLAEADQAGSPISLQARRALRTIDNVLLYQRLSMFQTELLLEPVHIGSSLSQVATDLSPLSIEHGCETEVFIQSGIATVDADREVLKSGIECLWQAMLGLTQKPSPITWDVSRARGGIRVAVYNNSVDLSKLSFAKAIKVAGTTRQPFSGVSGPATDLLTARNMFNLLNASLSKTKKDGLEGLAVTFRISPQLAFI